MARDDDAPPGGPAGTPDRKLSRRAALLFGAGAGAAAGGAVAAGVSASRGDAAPARPAAPPDTPVATTAPTGPVAAPAGPTADQLGLLAVEQFRTPGLGDDETVAAALRHAAAMTYKPAVVFANRAYDLTRPLQPYSGIHLAQLGHGDEFRYSQRIRVPAGGLLSFDPEVRSVTLEDLACELRDHLLQPIEQDASQGAWTDTRVLGGGYDGGTTLLRGAFLRLDFQPGYVNNVSDSVVRIGGSDSWLFTRGAHYVSGTLPPDRPFLDLVGLGQSVVGSAYVTAQGGYGVAVGGRGTGLRLTGTLVDATNRRGATATQLAGVQVTGGVDTTLTDLWVFNANVSGDSPAQVTVTGGEEVLFVAPRFPGTNGAWVAADRTGPCIHTTVPITVVTPKASGRARLITEAEPGLVTLVGAPGWTVRPG